MTENLHSHVIETERAGKINVYVQGDIEQARKGDQSTPVFLTVHDIGKNHHSWLNFVFHPSMSHVRERSVFIHVDILGQEDDAKDLPEPDKFPSLQVIGEDLINVLDTLRVKTVIGLGDGAGSNVLARFFIMHHTRCMGVVLLNPTCSAAGIKDKLTEKIANRFPRLSITNPPDYVTIHRFGYKLDEIDNDEALAAALDEYKDRIGEAKINPKNERLYVDAFMARDDIGAKLKDIPEDMLLMTGARNAYASNLDVMYNFCNKTKTSHIKVDDVNDALEELPDKVSSTLLLFCKGLGWLTTLATSGVERQRSASQSSVGSGGAGSAGRLGRRMSMEEYDKPNIRRLSLTGGGTGASPAKEEANGDKAAE